jgi:hypothetical protein
VLVVLTAGFCRRAAVTPGCYSRSDRWDHLRATCITNWLRAGLPVAEVARRAGNSPEVIHRRYAGVIDDSEEENNKKIEKTMGWEPDGS